LPQHNEYLTLRGEWRWRWGKGSRPNCPTRQQVTS